LNRACWFALLEGRMPREEHDREDLLQEAGALVERISLRIAGSDDELVMGFRRDGSASIYRGGDSVYQFTSEGQLRRAYLGPLLYKAERGRLVSLRRERADKAVQLIRHELGPGETREFLDAMQASLEALQQALARQRFTVLGQVPHDADLLGRITCWLDEFGGRVRIAASPRVG